MKKELPPHFTWLLWILILWLTPSVVFAQSTVQTSGTVLDANSDQPVPGGNVAVKGTAQGTVTDSQGKFTLSAAQGSMMVFSFIGYVSQEKIVTGDSSLRISLTPSDKNLEEVVVVGYGIQKKANLTGAVSTIDSKTIENRPVSNLANALQGTTPGMAITRTSGQPGNEHIQIQLRGATSANGNVNPLVMVDGVAVPITALQTMNPNDVENISVLKDAAASAIYGAQAAGGVILVTTKKGEAGKTIFEYSSLVGVDWALNVPTRMPLLEEAIYSNAAFENAGTGTIAYSELDLDYIRRGIPYRVSDTDSNMYVYYNQKDLISQIIRRNTLMQNHNLTARGGTDKVNFMVSLGHYRKQGTFVTGPDGLQRYNARLNLGAQLTNKLSLDARVAYTLEKQQAPSASSDNGGLLYQTYRLRTRWPIYTPEGRYNGVALTSSNNTYPILKDGGYNNLNKNIFDGVFTLRLADLAKGLQLRAIYGINYIRADRNLFARNVTLWNRFSPAFYLNNPNRLDITNESTLANNIQLLADYDFAFGDQHKIHLLGGYQFEDNRFSNVFSSASNLLNNDVPTLNLGDPITKTSTQNIQTSANQSVFGRLNYSFGERYLLEATIRMDESSRLAPGLRRKVFPSVSAGWNIAKETWFGGAFFNEIKLRGSWGQLGSALGTLIGNYDFLSLLAQGNNLVIGNPGQRTPYIYQPEVPSPNLSWETVETTNGGLDLGMAESRLRLSIDYYVKYNRNMLAPSQLPATFGIAPPMINNGKLKSWGWEIEGGYQDQISENFSWNIGFNVSDNQNRLISYSGRDIVSAGKVGILEGYPVNTLWGYQANGYFQTQAEVDGWAFQNIRTGPGDVKYLDLNADNLINVGKATKEDHGDLVYLGTTDPRYLFGVNGGMFWKGLDFSFLFQGVGRRSFTPVAASIMPLGEGWLMPFDIHRNFWTPENPEATFPRPFYQGYHNYLESDKWMMNARYVRLKNVQLGYTLPERWTSKLKITRTRIFLSGQDLLTFSGLGVFSDLFNPETVDKRNFDYPFFATAAIGINITF